MDNIHRGFVEALQPIEDELLDRGFDEVTIATQNGSWSWQSVARARELANPGEGAEPTGEEYDTAVRMIAELPQDHAKLAELIAGELARRRLAG